MMGTQHQECDIWSDTNKLCEEVLEKAQHLDKGMISYTSCNQPIKMEILSIDQTKLIPNDDIWDETNKLCTEILENTIHIDAKPIVTPPPNQPIEDMKISIVKAKLILNHCKEHRHPLFGCRNAIRGCKVNTFFKIVPLHERSCPFPKATKINTFWTDQTEGCINFLDANAHVYKAFCKTFSKEFGVYFLYKKSTRDSKVKITVCGYKEAYLFKIELFNEDNKCSQSIKDVTGNTTHFIQPDIHNQNQYSKLLKYKISIRRLKQTKKE